MWLKYRLRPTVLEKGAGRPKIQYGGHFSRWPFLISYLKFVHIHKPLFRNTYSLFTFAAAKFCATKTQFKTCASSPAFFFAATLG